MCKDDYLDLGDVYLDPQERGHKEGSRLAAPVDCLERVVFCRVVQDVAQGHRLDDARNVVGKLHEAALNVLGHLQRVPVFLGRLQILNDVLLLKLAHAFDDFRVVRVYHFEVSFN